MLYSSTMTRLACFRELRPKVTATDSYYQCVWTLSSADVHLQRDAIHWPNIINPWSYLMDISHNRRCQFFWLMAHEVSNGLQPRFQSASPDKIHAQTPSIRYKKYPAETCTLIPSKDRLKMSWFQNVNLCPQESNHMKEIDIVGCFSHVTESATFQNTPKIHCNSIRW